MKKETTCRSFESVKDARNRIFNHCALFCNRRRKHSYLGNISPDQFEMQRVAGKVSEKIGVVQRGLVGEILSMDQFNH